MNQWEETLKQIKKICGTILKKLQQLCRILLRLLMKLLRGLFLLLGKFWENILKPLAQKIRSLPWKKWARDLIQRLKTDRNSRIAAAALLGVLLVSALGIRFFTLRTDDSVSVLEESLAAEAAADGTNGAEVPEESAAEEAKESAEKEIPADTNEGDALTAPEVLTEERNGWDGASGTLQTSDGTEGFAEGESPETAAAAESPEMTASAELPETAASTEAPEMAVSTEASEMTASTEVPETATDAETPEMTASEEVPETDAAENSEMAAAAEAPETAADAETSEMAAAAETSEETNGESAAGNVDSSGRTELYQSSYDDTMEHMDDIIAVYWQNGGDSVVSGLEGTFEEFYNAVNELDPGFFDAAAAGAAYEYADNPLEYHLIESGLNMYFSDSEIGKGLRDISETFFLGMLDEAFRREGEEPSDKLQFCVGNMEYVLARTSGSLSALLGQIEKESGYYMAVTAIDDYYQQVNDYYTSNITPEMEIYMQGGEEAAKVGEKWDVLQGRMDALKDSRQAWNDSLAEWEEAFLADFSLSMSRLTAEDGSKHFYLIFDKNNTVCCSFLAPSSISDIRITDTGICSWRDETGFYVINKDGDALYSEEDMSSENGYLYPAPCGSIFRKTGMDDFDHGEYEVLELVHPDGSPLEIVRGYGISAQPLENPHYYGYKGSRGYTNWNWGSDTGSDIWEITYKPLDQEDSEDIIVHMDTDEISDAEEYFSQHPKVPVTDTQINEQYTLDPSTWELYETAAPENKAADFSAGQGLERLFYDEIHKQYWAISQSGYYYVLNEAFERIHEPIKIEGSWWDVCPYGIIVVETAYDEDSGLSQSSMALYDAEGNKLASFPQNSIMGFIGDIDTGFMESISKNGCFNILTNEQMYLKQKE